MDKNDLISYFYNTSRDFPIKQFTEDSLKHRELLFSDKPQEPVYGSYYDMSQSFISETNSRKEKNHNISNWRAKPERNNAKDNNVTKNNHDDTMNFFLQGVSGNKTEVEAFVKGSKNVEKNLDKPDKQKDEKFKGAFHTMDEKQEKSDSMIDTSQVVIGDISAENIKDTKLTEFIKNSDVTITNAKESVRNFPQENLVPNFHNMPNKVLLIPAFNPPIIPMPVQNMKYEPVKISNIFLFNSKTKIPNDFPLWYLHYPMPQQAIAGIGPISSKRLYEMFTINQVHANTDFRPIDVFKFTFNNFNEYAKLKLINDDEWISKIEDSPVLQYTELYSRSHKILSSEIVKNQTVEKIEKVEVEKIGKAEKNMKQEVILIEEKSNKKNDKQENIQTIQNTKNISNKILNQNETLNLTQPIQKNEIKNFVTDTIIEDTREKTLFLNVDIKKEIEADDSEQWEVVKKAKKKQKAQDESVYLIGNKQKEKIKKENKFNCKIDLIPSEELVNQLKPKQKQKETKPDFEAFNVIGNIDELNKNHNQQQQQQQFFDPNKKKKKNKGKPQDLDIKLGFKI